MGAVMFAAFLAGVIGLFVLFGYQINSNKQKDNEIIRLKKELATWSQWVRGLEAKGQATAYTEVCRVAQVERRRNS